MTVEKPTGQIYSEDQQFRQRLLWLPLLVAAAVLWYGFLRQVVG